MKTKKQFLSILLSLALVLGLMPGMSLTAYAASHNITINAAQHGSVVASVNGSAVTSAEEDATVTLTANPENGYRLKSISGTYKGYPTETLYNNAEGTYFKAESDDTYNTGWTIRYSDKPIKITSKNSSVKIDKVKLNIIGRGNSANQSTLSTTVGNLSLSENTITVSSVNSTTVTITNSSNNAGLFRIGSVTVYPVGIENVDKTLLISETSDTNVKTFTMPEVAEGAVSITAEFEEIPKYEVTYKVVNGTWSDDSTTDKTETVQSGSKPASVPTGMKAANGYTGGSWDTDPADTTITQAKTFTYTFEARTPISQTVTFKAVNGKWNDETTADKTVTLTGYEGDTLKLSADQIPAVGTKPNDTYKAGSWDVTPSTETAITEATTYTYTYVAKEAATVTKVPAAKNLTYTGSAQELVTAGEAEGGTMYYALGTATEATEEYKTSIPAKTDVGTYYVWYKAKGDENHTDSEAKPVEVKISEAITPGIKFDVTELSLKPEEEKKITATVVPEKTKVTWTSDKEAVATVDANGKVKAVSEGTATITGKITVDDKDYTAECKVTVTKAAPVVTPSIKFDATELSLKPEEEKTITATVVPENTKVTWTSDKEAVATVDANGKVKAVSEGTATITGKITVDGKEYTAECKVTVASEQTELVVVPEILSDDNLSQGIVERYGTLTQVEVTIKEAAGVAPDQTGNFVLYDAKVYVIENGVTRPATSADMTSEGLEAIFPYPEGSNRNQVFTGVHMISEDSGKFKAGDTEQMTFTNEDDGLHSVVHGLSPVIITWEDPAPVPTEAGITLSASEIYVTQGRENAITAVTKPEGTAVTWSSSDKSVATVDGMGVVTGLKPGTATITAKITVEGAEYTANCMVTVIPAGTPMPIPVPSGSKGGGEHTHNYVWKTIEATEDADGELRYQCETCGDIQTRVPLTAYNVFNKNTTEKIRKAPKDATVKIETNKWISFHKMVMEALAERPDVTLEISFLDEGHKGNRCTVVIPKGTDTMSLVDKNGFTGFLFLGGKFGMKTN